MLSVVIGACISLALFFFFPVSAVEGIKGFARRRASQWKGVARKGKAKVEVEVGQVD